MSGFVFVSRAGLGLPSSGTRNPKLDRELDSPKKPTARSSPRGKQIYGSRTERRDPHGAFPPRRVDSETVPRLAKLASQHTAQNAEVSESSSRPPSTKKQTNRRNPTSLIASQTSRRGALTIHGGETRSPPLHSPELCLELFIHFNCALMTKLS